jgi:anti-sigma B factor antagonist
MSMTLKTRKIGDVVILDFEGRLTLGEPTFILRELLREFLQNGYSKFIFNLGNLSYIDSSGLGALIESFTRIRNRQGDIKLLNLTSRAKDLMQMTKLLTVFDAYADEAAALQGLK